MSSIATGSSSIAPVTLAQVTRGALAWDVCSTEKYLAVETKPTYILEVYCLAVLEWSAGGFGQPSFQFPLKRILLIVLVLTVSQ